MRKYVLITGASRGIGEALAIEMSKNGYSVIAIGRDIERLQNLKAECPLNSIYPIPADILTIEGRKLIIESTKALVNSPESSLTAIVHNATVLDPIKPITSTTESDIEIHIGINYTGPLMLTNHLYPYMPKDSRILFISTGASKIAIKNLELHCAAKSAQAIIAEGLRKELTQYSIFVGLVYPGMVNTESQEYVRSLDKETLPFSEIAREKHQQKALSTPMQCAQHLFTLLCDVNSNDFVDTWPWNLNNPEHLENLKLFSQPPKIGINLNH